MTNASDSAGTPVNRRSFLAGAAIAFPALASARVAPEGPPMPIIDTHQHLWDLKALKLAWVKGNPRLDRSFLPSDYREAAEGLGIVRSVYLEVDVVPEQQLLEAATILEIIRRKAGVTAAAVISGRPERDDFPVYLDRFRDAKEIKGVRRILHGGETPQGHALSEEFIRGIRTLGERGLHFELCPRAGEMADMIKLVDACPDTMFVLDHLGNPNLDDLAQWRKDMDELAKRERVWCKVSGIVASAREGWTAEDLAPAVNHGLESFGPDRVMFGGDWPVCTLRATLKQWVEALQAIVAERPEAERRKLFHDNAVKCYRLG